MKNAFWNYLFWLVIAAAFIGPGTVTTAATAGASFQYQLIWALGFSILACFILQEAAARIAIVVGKPLGQALLTEINNRSLVWFIAGAIFLGCLAYEAGNILGAISGVVLIITGVPAWVFTLCIGLFSFPLLFLGKTQTVGNILGLVVGAMGLSFIIAALSGPIDLGAITRGAFLPQLPDGSMTIALGMLGTTIVPYNIFLGSSMAEGQSLPDMRKGLGLSVFLGGVISIAILVVGTRIAAPFEFEKLYVYLVQESSTTMGFLFAFGLFAAGFTSTITASMAGALTIKSVHPQGHSWGYQHRYYRGVWGFILVVGLALGATGIQAIPVIILAQAANGLILPMLTAGIWKVVFSKKLMGVHANSFGLNVLMGLTFLISSFLGLLNLLKALNRGLSLEISLDQPVMIVLAVISFLLLFGMIQYVQKSRE